MAGKSYIWVNLLGICTPGGPSTWPSTGLAIKSRLWRNTRTVNTRDKRESTLPRWQQEQETVSQDKWGKLSWSEDAKCQYWTPRLSGTNLHSTGYKTKYLEDKWLTISGTNHVQDGQTLSGSEYGNEKPLWQLSDLIWRYDLISTSCIISSIFTNNYV